VQVTSSGILLAPLVLVLVLVPVLLLLLLLHPYPGRPAPLKFSVLLLLHRCTTIGESSQRGRTCTRWPSAIGRCCNFMYSSNGQVNTTHYPVPASTRRLVGPENPSSSFADLEDRTRGDAGGLAVSSSPST
jgi:hypothetical protein